MKSNLGKGGYIFSIFIFMLFILILVVAVANTKSVTVMQESNYERISIMKASNAVRNLQDILGKPNAVNCTAVKNNIESEDFPFEIKINCSLTGPKIGVSTKSCSYSYGFMTTNCVCIPSVVDCGAGSGKRCGVWDDGCGGVVNCNPCASGQHCEAKLCVDNTATCDGDSICDPGSGETYITCRADCPCNSDGTCEPYEGEDVTTCPNDCHCGNGVYEPILGEQCELGMATTCAARGILPPASLMGHAAFDARADYSDLPNRKLSTSHVKSIRNMGSYWEINFTGTVGQTYSAGTGVREHTSGSAYMYSAASSASVPYSWTKYSATVTGESLRGWSTTQWWHGTRKAKLLILANYNQGTANRLLADNITLLENGIPIRGLNGDAEGGNVNWTSWDGISTTDKVGGANSFYEDGRKTLFSNTFNVDPAKTYRLEGWFKSAGLTPSIIYFGFAPLDSSGTQIQIDQVLTLDNTLTSLFQAVSSGDTSIKVADGSRWSLQTTNPDVMVYCTSDCTYDTSGCPR